MGKKNKDKSLEMMETGLRPFILNNKVVLAALGGVAVGIALSAILGSEKAKQLTDTVTDSIKSFSNKMKDEFVKQNQSALHN